MLQADFRPGDAASQADILTRAPARLTSYYYDLQVSSKPTKNDVMQTTIGVRVWYQAPNQWRIEHYSVPTGDLHDVVISDGETTWYYKVAEATYYQDPPVHQVLRGAHRGLGPLPAITFSSTWRTRATDQAITGPLRTVASSIQGIQAVLLVQACCDDGTLKQLLGEQHYWIDPTNNFLLRIDETVANLGGETLYELSDVQYNPKIDEQLFTFEPPAGVTEVPPP